MDVGKTRAGRAQPKTDIPNDAQQPMTYLETVAASLKLLDVNGCARQAGLPSGPE